MVSIFEVLTGVTWACPSWDFPSTYISGAPQSWSVWKHPSSKVIFTWIQLWSNSAYLLVYLVVRFAGKVNTHYIFLKRSMGFWCWSCLLSSRKFQETIIWNKSLQEGQQTTPAGTQESLAISGKKKALSPQTQAQGQNPARIYSGV